MIDFHTQPDRYQHWKLSFDGPIATLTMDVDASKTLFNGYELKLNSYDLGVDIELYDAVQRLRFEHPEVKTVILNSAKEKDKARPLFTRAWEIARRGKLDGLAVDAAHMMRIIEPPAEALRWNEEAMAYAEASDDPAAKRWLGALYNNMGWTHHDEQRYDKALALFEKGLAWRAERDDVEATRIAKWSVGRALRSLGRHDEAVKLQLELEAERKKADAPDGFVFEELGELYLKQGDKEKAKAYFAKAYPLLEKFDWVEKKRLERIRKLGGL